MSPAASVLGVAMVLLTVGAYAVARSIFARHPHPLLHPVFVSAGIIVLVLKSCGLGYGEYRPGREILNWLLGPATVALAAVVYDRRARLRPAALPLMCGVTAGALATMTAVLGLAALGALERSVLSALAFKSVTAPIAVELARLQGADPALAVIFVNITGLLGAIFGPAILTRCRVVTPVARGVALGTTSHALGTAAALLEDESAGAMSSLAMVWAAIVTALVAPLYVPWLLQVLTAP